MPTSPIVITSTGASVQTDRPRNLVHISRDVGYRFVKQDPILEEVCRLITNSGLSAQELGARSGVTPQTINSWLMGRTKKPLNLTVDYVLLALGYRRTVQRDK